jgi:hypothetical protein
MTTWSRETVNLAIGGNSLTVDNIKIDGTNIGHTDDTDLLAFANGALTVNGTLTTTGDLTVTGNNIVFVNGETISNTTNNKLHLKSPFVSVFGVGYSEDAHLEIQAKPHYDAKISFLEGPVKWTLGHDASASDEFCFMSATTTIAEGSAKMKLGSSGDLTIAGDLTITGGNITNAITCDSTVTVTGLLTGSGDIVAGDDIAVASTGKLSLDGIGGGTYIHEVSTDKVQLVVGGTAINMSQTNNPNTNTIYGHLAGDTITSGCGSNTFIGSYCGNSGGTMDAANSNTAIGYNMFRALTTGDSNHGMGHGAMFALTSGQYNIAIGTNALDGETNGSKNVAIGHNSLTSSNRAGEDADGANVAIGYAAGAAVTTGRYNTYLGHLAGDNATSGDKNVCIGYATDIDADADNQIAIGNGTSTDATNKGRWGNASISTNNIQTDWTVDSDNRIKDNITNSTLGLTFINALRPKTFTKVHPADYPEAILEARYKTGGGNFDDDTNQIIRDTFDTTKVWNGLVAQDVKATMDSLGVDFSGWSEEINGKQGISYSSLIMPLIKAVQELSARIDSL